MAKLLVKSTQNGTHEIGDVISIVENDHIFGKMELDENVFKIIKIDKTIQELSYLLLPYNKHLKNNALTKIFSIFNTKKNENPELFKRKKYKIDLQSHEILRKK